MEEFRQETDSLGTISVPKNALWGTQTQRSLEYFSIGDDLIPREMIPAYGILKKACAIVNYRDGRLDSKKKNLIVKVCDEIITGTFASHFPVHVWMTGSGTQFNMNVNEVIANRCSQLTGNLLGSKNPVHPNDDVNMSQSSNDTFPTAMHIATATTITENLLPAISELHSAIHKKVLAWKNIVKIGRTHMQEATPLTLGQEFSGYAAMLIDNISRVKDAMDGVYQLVIGGTAVGTGIHTKEGFDKEVAKEIQQLTKLPFVAVPNKFAAQGAHDALVHTSATLKTLAVSLYKIANDIILLSCGPRTGFAELNIPNNEPGSSIMPGKVNPTQCEALAMVAIQVMANDFAVSMGGASGYLEMNSYKPLIIHNILHSIRILSDSCHNFAAFLIDGTEPNLAKLEENVKRSLMLVTALSPVIGYDKASKIAHHALANHLTLKESALKLKYVSAEEFDKYVDPNKMLYPAKDI
jgi:fumarate hydratase class II